MERHSISTKQFTPRGVQSADLRREERARRRRREYERLAMDPFAEGGRAGVPLARRRAADGERRRLRRPARAARAHAAAASRQARAVSRSAFSYILVDEYQDTNRAQYELIKLLGGGHGNVCVVGDDDQSIYGWRGADIRNILDFNKDFPDATVVRLEENYRSTPQILDAGERRDQREHRAHGKDAARHARGRRAGHGRAVARRARRSRVRRRRDRWRDDRRRRRSRLNDVAVLYRTNAQSRALEEALRRHAMPYRLVGAVRFYDRREIRDLMAYLKLIANPADDEAFRRAVGVPKRGLGETTIELLAEQSRAARPADVRGRARRRGHVARCVPPRAPRSPSSFALITSLARARGGCRGRRAAARARRSDSLRRLSARRRARSRPSDSTTCAS